MTRIKQHGNRWLVQQHTPWGWVDIFVGTKAGAEKVHPITINHVY